MLGDLAVDKWLRTLEHVLADAALRHELLWLRAHERADLLAARWLEHFDPGLRQRLLTLGIDDRRIEGESRHERAERFGHLYDERWAAVDAALEAER